MFDIKRSDPGDDTKETITFTYFVQAVGGVPTFFGIFELANCCTADNRDFRGSTNVASATTRTELRLCVEFGLEG